MWVWSLGLGKSPGGGHGNPFQYSCLENPMDRGAWWATVHRVEKSRMLSHFSHIWLFATPGSSVHGIYQARILEWVTMPSSRGSPPSRDRTHISWFCALAGGFFTTSATWEAYIYISWNSVMFKFVDLKHKTVWFSRRNVRVVKVLYLLQMPCNTPWPPPWDASLSPSRCYFLTFCYLKDWIKHLGTVFSWTQSSPYEN